MWKWMNNHGIPSRGRLTPSLKRFLHLFCTVVSNPFEGAAQRDVDSGRSSCVILVNSSINLKQSRGHEAGL